MGGECRSPCEGVKCPVGRECRLGACLDPCAGVTCPAQRTCVSGACVVDCSCTGCTMEATCNTQSGVCVDNDCLNKSCATGTFCAPDGSCADSCQDAACPAGSRCEVGECVAVVGGADVDAGGSTSGDGTAGSAGGNGDGGENGGNGSGGNGAGGGGAEVAESDSGCGCRVARAKADTLKLALSFALVALFGLRRARRRA